METFVVAFHNGCWRIGYNGQWYGSYPDRISAQKATVAIARESGELPTRVVVHEPDGSEEIVWEPDNAPDTVVTSDHSNSH
jgi:hypothetical protein